VDPRRPVPLVTILSIPHYRSPCPPCGPLPPPPPLAVHGNVTFSTPRTTTLSPPSSCPKTTTTTTAQRMTSSFSTVCSLSISQTSALMINSYNLPTSPTPCCRTGGRRSDTDGRGRTRRRKTSVGSCLWMKDDGEIIGTLDRSVTKLFTPSYQRGPGQCSRCSPTRMC
jgi:hypothetical protein